MKRSHFIKCLLLSPFAFSAKSCFRSPQSGLDDQQSGTNTRRVVLNEVTNNHGHLTIDLTPDDIEKGSTDTFILSGGGHDHLFTITPLQYSTLIDGQPITVTVTGNFHSHIVSISYSQELEIPL